LWAVWDNSFTDSGRDGQVHSGGSGKVTQDTNNYVLREYKSVIPFSLSPKFTVGDLFYRYAFRIYISVSLRLFLKFVKKRKEKEEKKIGQIYNDKTNMFSCPVSTRE
jgi:hypothetical protein